MEITKLNIDKDKFQSVLKTSFVNPTAEIYGGVQGFFDYGPDGDRILKNLIYEWDKFFARKERMLTIECPIITPERVLKASGHVDRFNDYLVKDSVTGESFRADHLIEAHLEKILTEDKSISPEKKKEIEEIVQQIDNFGERELSELISRFQMKSPSTNNDLSAPKPFNLMFDVMIGPSGTVKGYLRPETAQGIFVNFKRLLEKKQGKLPFAVAQIGISCRNEISPRSGLLRVREFKMAEIEHFLDPEDKSHRRFPSVAGLSINMFTSDNQVSGRAMEVMNLGDAVRNKVVANETLGYFMGRIYLFLMKVGIKPEWFRFRQHMPNEMAHYACDCWDAECLTTYGWIECVGCADRSAYDLTKHAEHSGVKLVAQRQLQAPKTVSKVFCRPVMSQLGQKFKKNSAIIGRHLESLSGDDARQLSIELQEQGREKNIAVDNIDFAVTKEMFELVEKQETVHVEEFVPNVIEPSFGLGRIFYCMLEQNFSVRPTDPNRSVFSIPAWIASYQFSILPLSANEELLPLTERISDMLEDLDILSFVDATSASIGKRYARTDSIGIPFGITIDFDSVNTQPASVTVRERDSMKQVRVKVDDLAKLAERMVKGGLSWDHVLRIYPLFEGQTN